MINPLIERNTMATPRPAPIPLTDGSDELLTILSQLKCRPDHRRFGELYDLTGPVVYSWALGATDNLAGAESATLATYAWLWRWSRCYPGRSFEAWSWVRAATVRAVIDQRRAARSAA